MEIFPAIDLRGGKVVRLRQGDPNAQTTWADDPAQIAQQWVAQGARWLHVVNLDGAFATEDGGRGTGENLAALERIINAVPVPIQFGGGVRDLASVERVLCMGVARVVLGTMAIQQPEIVREVIIQFGAARIVVGLDARDGMVTTHGWQSQSARTAVEVARQMRELGAQRIVFTDIARDGMLHGANIDATRTLARESEMKVIASGGVASLDDIRQLKACESYGIEGVIIGQALFTGALTINDAIRIADAI